ncbi:response regulator transcription factor [Peribacillus loiseleuriae]|uniref:response regulator transcription factor n=1 Tax=Peribacillus loiseleuriae TaxID=1679170 RepID=UPI003D0221BC
MQKVIIVDDDRIIRQWLSTAIPWQEYGFKLAGEASDGETAIELIEKEQPQIVISDINMPFMDGLELAKQVKSKSPDTYIIFMTGYEDFKYAHEALKLKVFDYLLKPVDKDQLLEKIKEAAMEWKANQKREKNLVEVTPYLQRNIFHKLTEPTNIPIDIEQELLSLGIELQGSCFVAILIKIDERSPTGINVENLKTSIKAVISQDLKKNQGAVMDAGIEQLLLLLSPHEEIEEIKISRFIHHLFQEIHKKIGIYTTVTFGRIYQEPFEMGFSILEAHLAMNMRHIMGKGQVYTLDDIVSDDSHYQKDITQLEEELVEQIKRGLPDKANETIQLIFRILVECKDATLQDIRFLAVKYITLLFHEAEKWNWRHTNSEYLTDHYREVMKMETLHEIFDLVQSILQEWKEFMNQKKEKNSFTIVDQAMEYVDAHYHLEGLTLQKVANIIHVSAPYLSNLFKVEKGINFGDYLLGLRMRKAMELFSENKIKTYEVADMVGYNNPQYFSICFKKYTGYTPAEYRKTH